MKILKKQNHRVMNRTVCVGNYSIWSHIACPFAFSLKEKLDNFRRSFSTSSDPEETEEGSDGLARLATDIYLISKYFAR